MKRFALVLLVSILAMGAEARAQNFSRAAVCTAENSEATDVAAIAADPKGWYGRCAQVDGLYSGERVYADIDAIYGRDGDAIGGFIDGAPPMPGAWRGHFVGRVFDCAEAWDTVLNQQLRTPGISLNGRPLGCVDGKGPFLMFMAGSGLESSGLKRRLPGAKGGNLVSAPPDWPHRAMVTKLAERFLAAMDEKSTATLAELMGNAYLAGRLVDDDRSVWSRLVSGQATAFSVLEDTSVTGAEMAGEACWSLVKDFARRWPIDSRDADNQAKRPYACLRVEGVRRDGQWVTRIDPYETVDGLEEP